ncbi:MAG: leucyl/phenylalanyl-tRNA--protein transferase [Pedobacter sp.]|nr:MAG: leucyl/phenylalanyl-tRNA--protein transferase [Pedobacter sp.]
MPYLLNPQEVSFPLPGLADEDGLLAIGGDLSLERLVLAYENGIFPWYQQNGEWFWFSPLERCVIFPAHLKISKSMRALLKKGHFSITHNHAFQDVIKNCATIKRADDESTSWINPELQEAYTKLYQHGYAHSLEVWLDEKLVGGLYGVFINGVFIGESMFSKVSNASKIALIYLGKLPQVKLIDCQVPNPHLISMGAELIPQESYLAMLRARSNPAL